MRPHCRCCLHGRSISARAHLPPGPASLQAMALAASRRLASCLHHLAVEIDRSRRHADYSSQLVHPGLGAGCLCTGSPCLHQVVGLPWARLTRTVCSLLAHAASDIGVSLNLFNSCRLQMMLMAPLAKFAACHIPAATMLCELHAPGWHGLTRKSKPPDSRLAPWSSGLSLGCLTHQARAGTRGPPGHPRTMLAAASHAQG